MTQPNTSTGLSGSVSIPNQAPEQAIVNRYKQACAEVEDARDGVEAAAKRLKAAKAEKSRLYKVASVIDPSLKDTRPKS